MQTTNVSVEVSASNDSLSCDSAKASAQPFYTCAYILLVLASLALNSITVRVYFFTSHCRPTAILVFLKNLAAADFLLCCSLLLRITKYISSSEKLQLIYCNFGAPFFYLNMHASILFIGYIAANRYLKIIYPLKKQALKRVKVAHYVSATTWVLCLGGCVLFIGFYSSWEIEKFKNVGCDFFTSNTTSTIYKAYQSISVAGFLFVLLCLVLMYWNIGKRLQSTAMTFHESPKINRSKRNMLMLVAVFCVCFVPYHLIILPDTFLKPALPHCPWDLIFATVKELTVLFCSLNACLDPLIYFMFSRAFRAQMSFRRKSCDVGPPCASQNDTGRSNSAVEQKQITINSTM